MNLKNSQILEALQNDYHLSNEEIYQAKILLNGLNANLKNRVEFINKN